MLPVERRKIKVPVGLGQCLNLIHHRGHSGHRGRRSGGVRRALATDPLDPFLVRVRHGPEHASLGDPLWSSASLW